MSDVQQQVMDAGIVGAGGAGFPTHVKFGSVVDTVIANGAECEPLLQCDKAVLREHCAEVLDGLQLLQQATRAKRAVIAVKGHYADVVACVQQTIDRQFPSIELFLLDNFYPAGDEQVLLHEITGRIVPEGGIPLNVGVVVDNVITLMQVANAVRRGQPVTARPLTICGEVQQPMTCIMPIGASMRDAVDRAGGALLEDWVVLEGGPMMGRIVDADAPISKKTSGIIVLPAQHELVLRRQVQTTTELKLARAVCCQCRMCTDLCPRFNLGHALQPHLTMRSLLNCDKDAALSENQTSAFLCCLCGACEAYACTLGLSPRRVYAELREQLLQAKQRNPHQRADLMALPERRERRIPLPRLLARLGLSDYAQPAHRVDWNPYHAKRVRLRLQQHIGAPAVPVVALGQQVQVGELVAEIAAQKLGARVHASISGTIVAMTASEIVIDRSAADATSPR